MKFSAIQQFNFETIKKNRIFKIYKLKFIFRFKLFFSFFKHIILYIHQVCKNKDRNKTVNKNSSKMNHTLVSCSNEL